MTLTILFAAGASRWPAYQAPLTAALAEAGVDARLVRQAAPETVDAIVYAPGEEIADFTPYTRCRAVLSLWAGVDPLEAGPLKDREIFDLLGYD